METKEFIQKMLEASEKQTRSANRYSNSTFERILKRDAQILEERQKEKMRRNTLRDFETKFGFKPEPREEIMRSGSKQRCGPSCQCKYCTLCKPEES